MKDSFIVIGIDPGYDRLGIAVVQKHQGKETILFSDCIQTNKKDSDIERIFMVGSRFRTLLQEYKPDHVAIEKLFFVTNIKSGIAVAGVCGVIKFLTHEMGVPLYEYAPTEVKVALTSYGRADKNDVHKMVSKLVVLPQKKQLDDEIDAIAIALTHIAHKKAF